MARKRRGELQTISDGMSIRKLRKKPINTDFLLDVKPLTEKESYDILRERESNNNEISNKAAYNLLEQTRKNNEQNAMFWGSLKLLGNK